MNTAIYYKKTRVLYIWYSRNTSGYVDCSNVAKARNLIEMVGCQQKLTIKL